MKAMGEKNEGDVVKKGREERKKVDKGVIIFLFLDCEGKKSKCFRPEPQ